MDAQEQDRKILAGWGAANGLNFDIIDPSTIVNPTAPLLRKRLTSDGASLWCTGDPVHLFPDAYQDLVGAFSEEGDGSVTGEPDGSISASSEGLKRRNPESVVTLPKMPAAKRGRRGQNVAAAGWLTGTPHLGVRVLAGAASQAHGAAGGATGVADGPIEAAATAVRAGGRGSLTAQSYLSDQQYYAL
jgi:hypothetical protein